MTGFADSPGTPRGGCLPGALEPGPRADPGSVPGGLSASLLGRGEEGGPRTPAMPGSV